MSANDGYLLDTNVISETRVLDLGAGAARLWGELSAARSLPVIDTLIAATAIHRGLTLVTRNTRDVAATGVATLDPWIDG